MPLLDCPVSKKDWDHEVGARNGITAHPEEPALTEAGPWEPAVQKIFSFQHLGDDWDGLGAKAPSRQLLESAIGLAYILSDKGVDPPDSVVPGVDGSVTFEWQDPDGTYREVEIVRPLYAEVMMIEPGKPAKHWTLPTEAALIDPSRE
jgi:hypothetical protein